MRLGSPEAIVNTEQFLLRLLGIEPGFIDPPALNLTAEDVVN
jgi:hypothetical protein